MVMTRTQAAPVLVLIAILTSNPASPAEPLDWPALVVPVTNGTPIVIPGTGTSGPANPYPPTIGLGGFTGVVVEVTVRLNGFAHTFPDDVDIVLAGPGGQRVLLMSDVGGSTDVTGLNLTFQDGAAALPDAGPLVTGTFSPTNFGTGDTFPPPAPAAPYGTALSDFNGTSPNGTWSLFVVDDAGGDVGSITGGFTLTVTTNTNSFNNNTPLPIFDNNTTESQLLVSGITGAIGKVTVSFHITHTFDADLDIFLVGPDNTAVELTSDNGGGGDNFGTSCGARTTFDDAAGTSITAGTAPFVGTFRPEGSLSAFSGKSGTAANGVWKLRIVDDAGADVGTLQCWTLTIAGNAPTSANDAFTTPFQTPLSVPAPGLLANDNSNDGGPLSIVQVSVPANGFLSIGSTGNFTYTPNAGFVGVDTFTYRAGNSAGPGSLATVSITVQNATVAQPPTVLLASSIVGNTVTLRWTPPAIGPAPTEYLLEGGVLPGEVLGSIPTGSPLPIFSFVAPTGSFFVRLKTIASGSMSGSSNEIQIHVNVPVAPSAPSGLVGTVNGTNFNLAWRNTFGGGAPTQLFLDVSGSASATLGLGLSDHVAFQGVPGGTYTMSLRASNAGGFSASSNAITLTFPGPCSGPPLTPINFLAYNVGSTVNLIWDPAVTGPAPTEFVLIVSGSFVGNVPTTSRVVSAPAPPGSYGVRVVATNDCGGSAPTPMQVVTVP
jgi:subtilisin-like proprotein convertase family protein